ncbi:MAG: UDP-N-acetylglucosamine 1-carboxyvinyltransferase [Bacteriovoracaceae bacterium]|nr:UDP-N-acetylglucosamine 1-carboxyvinyltransferase [Bacteriovoracaceae bacterium]
MDKLYITGPATLKGSVAISRSKNSYLPIMAACLLNPNPVHLKNLPELRDIRTMLNLLKKLGVQVEKKGNITTLNAANITSTTATYDLVKTMRASVLVLGPLLARFNKADVSLPGGCAIGERPIDIHLKNLTKLGANINLQGGYVEATCSKLTGSHLVLTFPSVGATENLMMAATLSLGKTVIENAALEPEIADLAHFLTLMGAKIEGIGTSKITIFGLSKISDFCEVEYEAIADRIEASTYLIAALITNSQVLIEKFNPTHIDAVIGVLKDMGANFEIGPDFIKVNKSKLSRAKIDTSPYPGFPTDVQAQLMALLAVSEGSSRISEHIFENRFMHVPELKRLGCQIELKGRSAFIEGGSKLMAAPVMCTDLRASAALVLAALSAQGTTQIGRVYHLDRGYEKLDQKLRQLGVEIQRVNE